MICNIQVDVNGEQLFFVDKNILACYSNRVSKLHMKITNNTKLIFNDFPGGAEGFELITRFCYNNGTIELSPSNIFVLHGGGSFMEITTLIKQTELYLEGIHCWAWSEFVIGLKQCHILYPFLNKSPTFQVFLNTLLGNLAIPSYDSSCPSSSNRSSFSDHSPKSSRCNHINFRKFDDLSFLNMDLFENLVQSMISLHLDASRICSLVFHYQKSNFFSCYSHEDKCKIMEMNINLLSLVNCSAFSCRALLDAFGMSLSFNLRTNERLKLENLLGSRLDEFTINDLLVRGHKKEAFDVDLILRLIKSFLLEKRINGLFAHRVKKVGFLIDLFMLEVAPDPFLKPSKFLALALALPDLARESHDGLYHAINLYIEVHARGLSGEQNTKLLSVIDLHKCSMVLNENTRLLPSDKQNRFKGRINNDFRVLGKQGLHVTLDTPKLMPKKSRTFDPCNAKSLPRLCH